MNIKYKFSQGNSVFVLSFEIMSAGRKIGIKIACVDHVVHMKNTSKLEIRIVFKMNNSTNCDTVKFDMHTLFYTNSS